MCFLLQVNVNKIDGNTPLCEACAHGNLELVRLLLSRGAIINPGVNYRSPLHEAVLNGGIIIYHLIRPKRNSVTHN